MVAPLITFLQTVSAEADTTRTAILGLAAAMEKTAARVEAATAKVRQAVTTTAEAVSQCTVEIGQQTEDCAAKVATKFDDLKFAAQNVRNIWGDELRLAIEAVEAGAMRLHDFVRKYGKFELEISGKLTSIRSYLAGMDFSVFERRFQNLITGLRKGSKDIEDILAYLGETQSGFVAKLLEMIEMFRRGELTLRAIEDAVKSLKEVYGGTDLAELMDVLMDELRAESASKGGFL